MLLLALTELIKMINPDKKIGEIFRSRKGSFSLNILVILYNYLNCNKKYYYVLYIYVFFYIFRLLQDQEEKFYI